MERTRYGKIKRKTLKDKEVERKRWTKRDGQRNIWKD